MIRHINYGELWSPYYQDWRDPYTEEEAWRKHEQKEYYTALVTEEDGATVAVELCFAGTYCNLYFHDALGRNAVSYTYELTADGRLFLCGCARTQFQDTNRLGSSGIAYSYTQDGRRKTFVSMNRQLSVPADNEPVDVSTHFVAVPPFRQWEPLLHHARNHPP